MQVVRVPKPSPDAFHRNRRISDLLVSQLEHFRHVAEKKSLKIDLQVARDTHTEGGAARYIAAVTRALRGRATVSTTKGSAVLPIEQARTRRPAKAATIPKAGVAGSIAAAAEAGHPDRSATTRPTQGPKKPQKGKVATTAKAKSKKKSGPEPKPKAAPRSAAKTRTKKTKSKKSRRS
jgi:hypothetical protein